MSTLNYRPDIDGLRALAVLPVVFFHAGLPGITGGYIGVDIFFVISGFLITSIIAQDIAAGRFSILEFYDRRVRRIFPALLVVLAFTSVAASLVLVPSDLSNYGKSLGATSVFLSNVYFMSRFGYFGNAAEELPLLHTWSLAIEEQFYVIFPVALALLFRLGGFRLISVPVLAGAAFSLGLAEWGVRDYPQLTFYLLPTRGWELLLGAIVALPILPDLRHERWRMALGLLGLAAIGYAIVAYDSETRFPGLSAFVPCAGAALILYAGRGGPCLSARILSVAPLTFVGRISYSLYLWHWPLLVLLRLYLDRPLATHEAIGVVMLAMLVSVLSYRFVETPFRNPSLFRGSAPMRLALGTTSMVCLAGFAAALIATNGLSYRAPDGVIAADAATLLRNPLRDKCHVEDAGLPPVSECLAGAPSPEGRYQVVVWGDSHADSYLQAVAFSGEREGLRVRQMTKSSCSPILGRDDSDCEKFNRRVLETIAKNKDIQIVVVAGRWSCCSMGQDESVSVGTPNEGGDVDLLAGTVRQLTALGVSVLLMGQVPEYARSPGKCVARSLFFGRDTTRCSETRRARVVAYTKHAVDVIDDIASSTPRVRAYMPIDQLCDPTWCHADHNSQILYLDDDHLNVRGARYLGGFVDLKRLLAEFGRAQTKLAGMR